MRAILRFTPTEGPNVAAMRTKTLVWTVVALLLIAATQVLAFDEGGWQPGLILLGMVVVANFLRVYRRRK